MNTLTVGNVVTIKVRNPLYHTRHRSAPGVIGPEFNVYTGTIIREKWFGANEIGITTGNPYFPFRRIDRERIVEVGGAKVDYQPVKSVKVTKTVQGSKGQTYIVTAENGKATCTCPGFSFRKTCKHIVEVMA